MKVNDTDGGTNKTGHKFICPFLWMSRVKDPSDISISICRYISISIYNAVYETSTLYEVVQTNYI